MEQEPKFRANERQPRFLGKLAVYLVPDSPELVTAQPQLLIVLIMLNHADVRLA